MECSINICLNHLQKFIIYFYLAHQKWHSKLQISVQIKKQKNKKYGEKGPFLQSNYIDGVSYVYLNLIVL